LVVFASGKDRRDPANQLHTNFSLNAEGEYLGLIKPDGVTATTEFSPKFPEQSDDVSYGVTQPTAVGEAARTGFFKTATPGARNGDANSLLVVETVAFSRASGPFAAAFSLTLTGAVPGQRIRFVVGAPSAAAAEVAEPTGTSTQYAGPISISSSVIVRAAVFSPDNTQKGKTATVHFVRLGTTGTARLDNFGTQMPILVIDTHGSGAIKKGDPEKAAWLYLWNPPATGATTLTAPPSVTTALTANVRGQSSADFPKKGFSLNLTNTRGGSRSSALIDANEFDNYKLISAWNYDKTYLHNAFIYALSNRIDRWAPRTKLVEVFLNTDGGDLDYADYAGIYILTDSIKVDSHRVAIAELDLTDLGPKSITGGYLFKADLPDADEFSFTTTRGFPGLPAAMTVVSPTLSKLAPEQRAYIQGNVQAFEDALYADFNNGFRTRTHLDYITRGAWVDHHLLNTFASNVDAFFRSAYFSKDREGRINAGPAWDFDRSMDGGEVRAKNFNVWQGPDGTTNFWADGWWGVLARDTDFMQAWIDRWQMLRKTEMSDTGLASLVDALAAGIDPAAAARDAAKWPNDSAGLGNTPRFTGGWAGEVNNLKTWLTSRAGWIDSAFTPPPTVTTAAGTVTLTPAAGTQLAYTTDGTDPRGASGALPATTRLSATAVTLPDMQDIQARSYNASFNPATVPGSPWSLRVGGPKSSAAYNIVFTTQPASQTVATGSTVIFSVANSTNPNLQWQRNGINVPVTTTGANATTLVLSNVTAAQAGIYTVNATNGTGSLTSSAATLNVASTVDVGRLVNLSVLTDITAAVPSFTVGTVVAGPDPNATKPLVVRAAGPGLGALGVPNTLADPKVDLYAGQTVVASNDNWGGSATLAAAMAGVGAFPYPSATSRDAAIYNPALPPRDYTVAVSGVGGATGTVIAEVYDATPNGAYTATTPRLINVSVLKQVAAGGAITLGFYVGGTTAKTILIRAIGPGLSQLGVPGVMSDPKLTLFNSTSVVIATNNDWDGDPALSLMMARVNAFAISNKNSKDAMLLRTLPPGGYVAQASGGGNSSGYVIVEAYEVP
jgi:predicted Rdx family selenoprotein